MSEMVERVADAIEGAHRNNDDSRAAMVRMARAAIAAMREPGGKIAFDLNMAMDERPTSGKGKEVWAYLIDRALSEKHE